MEKPLTRKVRNVATGSTGVGVGLAIMATFIPSPVLSFFVGFVAFIAVVCSIICWGYLLAQYLEIDLN